MKQTSNRNSSRRKKTARKIFLCGILVGVGGALLLPVLLGAFVWATNPDILQRFNDQKTEEVASLPYWAVSGNHIALQAKSKVPLGTYTENLPKSGVFSAGTPFEVLGKCDKNKGISVQIKNLSWGILKPCLTKGTYLFVTVEIEKKQFTTVYEISE